MTYAANTDVSVERSRMELERTLAKYGADGFAYMTRSDQATVLFEMSNRRVAFELPLPSKNERRFTHSPTGRIRSNQAAVVAAWEQACRQKWRALNLAVKAKLESIEAGIAEFEDEFLSYIVLPDGTSVGKWMKPQIEHAYEGGQMPALMPGSK